MRLGSLGRDKANNRAHLETDRNFMPLLKCDFWYWLDKRFFSLARREIKYCYTEVELAAADNNIDGMGIKR